MCILNFTLVEMDSKLVLILRVETIDLDKSFVIIAPI